MSQAEITALPIGSIKVTGNVRKHFDAKAHEELTENIRKVGVLQPLLVRKNGAPGVYELIAGERRLRAARAADLKDIPVRLLECTDEEALEIQAFENLHRKDLGPIEEARAFKMLLDGGKHDVKSLAQRVDKSDAYVYRSLKLLELPETFLDKIESGDVAVSIGYQILRAGEKYRETLIKFATTKYGYSGRLPNLNEVKDQVERSVEKKLSDAIFPLDVANYGGTDRPACRACPFNSSNQDALNLGLGSAKSCCTDGACYSKRTAARYQELRQEGETKFGPVLAFHGDAKSPYYGGDDPKEIKGAAVVDPKDPKIKKALKEKPESFAFGILKPNGYDSKKPRIVLVTTDKAVKKVEPRDLASRRDPVEEERQQKERELIEFRLNNHLLSNVEDNRANLEVALSELDNRSIYEALDLKYDHYAGANLKTIRAKKLPEIVLRRAILIGCVDDWETERTCEKLGLNVDAVIANAKQDAAKEWAKTHPPKDKATAGKGKAEAKKPKARK